MQGFRLRRARILYLTALVAYNEVGFPLGYFRLQPPTTFVVHDDDLECLSVHKIERRPLLFHLSVEYSERVFVVGELTKLLFPHADNRLRTYDEHTLDAFLFFERTRYRYRHHRFARSHIREQSNAFTFLERLERKVVSILLMNVELCFDSRCGVRTNRHKCVTSAFKHRSECFIEFATYERQRGDIFATQRHDPTLIFRIILSTVYLFYALAV